MIVAPRTWNGGLSGFGRGRYLPKEIFSFQGTYPGESPKYENVKKFKPRSIHYDIPTAQFIRSAYGKGDGIVVTWNGKQFQRNLADLAAYSGKTLNRVVSDTAVSLIKRIMRYHPVDTGRSRAGWSSYLNYKGVEWQRKGNNRMEIYRGITDSTFEENFPNWSVGRRSVKSGLINSLKGKSIYVKITNGVVDPVNGYPYILTLEFGRNGVPGKGFLVRSIKEQSMKVKQNAKIAKKRYFAGRV